jgi:hypothetical protein
MPTVLSQVRPQRTSILIEPHGTVHDYPGTLYCALEIGVDAKDHSSPGHA